MTKTQNRAAVILALVLSLFAVALIFKGDAENQASANQEPPVVAPFTFISPSFSGQEGKQDAEFKKRVDDMERAASTQIADHQVD
jgi:hypothetical protein